MELLRDIAVNGRQRDLLDRCVLLVVPVFSPDSHERSGRFKPLPYEKLPVRVHRRG